MAHQGTQGLISLTGAQAAEASPLTVDDARVPGAAISRQTRAVYGFITCLRNGSEKKARAEKENKLKCYNGHKAGTDRKGTSVCCQGSVGGEAQGTASISLMWLR